MEQSNLLELIKESINHNNLIKMGVDKAVIVGCSGGADSMTLFDCLFELKDYYGVRLHPVHINHLLRETSTREAERLSKEFRERYATELIVIASDVKKVAKLKKMGIEECGRYVRRYIFEEIAKKLKATKIALGHNLDDQVETIIYRMVRGTGLKGLCGMKVMDGPYIRPLLFLEKSYIREYATKKRLFFIEDSSNLELLYHRNIIRHNVVPMLTQLNSEAKKHIAMLSKKVLEKEWFFEQKVKKLLKRFLVVKGTEFFVFSSNLLKLESVLAKEAIRCLYEMSNGSMMGIDTFHVEMFYEGALVKDFFSVQFPHDIVMTKSSGIIFVSKKSFNSPPYSLKLKRGKNILPFNLGCIEVESQKEGEMNLTIRGFREGDKYEGKKMKELLYNAGIPKVLRELMPVVADDSNILFTPLVAERKVLWENSERFCKINFCKGKLYSKMFEKMCKKV